MTPGDKEAKKNENSREEIKAAAVVSMAVVAACEAAEAGAECEALIADYASTDYRKAKALELVRGAKDYVMANNNLYGFLNDVLTDILEGRAPVPTEIVHFQ